MSGRAAVAMLSRNHRCHRRQVKPTHKDTQAAKERALLFIEQPVTVLDGGAQGALPRRQIVRTLHQQIETAILQVRQELGRREEIDLRRTQFQRQRQAVQPLANRFEGWLILGREAKVGIHRLGALDKQFDGGREIERRHLDSVARRADAAVRDWWPRHTALDIPPATRRSAARHRESVRGYPAPTAWFCGARTR